MNGLHCSYRLYSWLQTHPESEIANEFKHLAVYANTWCLDHIAYLMKDGKCIAKYVVTDFEKSNSKQVESEATTKPVSL